MYDEADVRHGVTRKSQAKNVLLCKTEVGKVRIERRDWWLISPVTTMRVEQHAAVANILTLAE